MDCQCVQQIAEQNARSPREPDNDQGGQPPGHTKYSHFGFLVRLALSIVFWTSLQSTKPPQPTACCN